MAIVPTPEVDAVIQKHFSNAADTLRLFGLERYVERREAFSLVFKTSSMVDGGVFVELGIAGLTSLLAFTISPYPACCGIRMLHTFRVKDSFPPAILEEILNTFFANLNEAYLGKCRRLEIVMVEGRPGFATSLQRGLQGYIEKKHLDDNIRPVADPQISYKPLWDYFNKNAHKVNTRLMLNLNTGNILHNMEVIL